MIGIYRITNLVNKKVYIGQSWDVEKRFQAHKQNAFGSHNQYLRRSINKHGLSCFTFDILIEIKKSPFTQKWLDLIEDRFIRSLGSTNPNCGYNLRYGGSRGLQTEISKENNRRKHLGKCFNLSKQAKLNISNARKGMVFSETHKQNMSKSRMGNHFRPSVKIINLDTKEIFESLKLAGLKYNISSSNIGTVCKGRQKTAAGYRWAYL